MCRLSTVYFISFSEGKGESFCGIFWYLFGGLIGGFLAEKLVCLCVLVCVCVCLCALVYCYLGVCVLLLGVCIVTWVCGLLVGGAHCYFVCKLLLRVCIVIWGCALLLCV